MKKNNKTIFRLIKQIFTVLLSFSGSLATKWISLNNEPSVTRPNLISLSPVEYTQTWPYYSFMLSYDRCNGRCSTFLNASSRICVLNTTDNVNLKVFFNMAKTLIKHILCNSRRKFYSWKCNLNQKWNNNKGGWECEKSGILANLKNYLFLTLKRSIFLWCS